jgi:exodeoxyribonuclease III
MLPAALTVATWNVNGIRARGEQLLAWLERDQPQVVALQELKAKPEQIPEAILGLDAYWHVVHCAGAYSGVSLHLRKDICPEPPVAVHPDFDFETRIVSVELGETILASVYVPNGGKDFAAKMRFLQALEAYTAAVRAAGKRLILCGDLNVALTDRDVHPRALEKPNAIGTRPEERALLAAALSHDLVDVGRALDPDNDELFTWWAPWRKLRERNIGWRIDFVLASAALAASARTACVLTEVGTSDHAPVWVEFGPDLG